jgi:hypothetical protein
MAERTPVETLQEAAMMLRDIRDELPSRFRDLADPVADWLEDTAAQGYPAPWCRSGWDAALVVARIVLGVGKADRAEEPTDG